MNLIKLWKRKYCKKLHSLNEGGRENDRERPAAAGRGAEAGQWGVKDDGEEHWRRAALGYERGRERETLGVREGEK